jgi:FAD/FMN-containing dehydrogenase
MTVMTNAIELAALDGSRTRVAPTQLGELSARLDGHVLRPRDAGWGEAVRIWNGMVAKVPAFVVQPASAADVAAAVRFAREHGLLLGVKGGGHNIAGTSIAEHGLNLDMSRMRDVAVDVEARVAHVGAGCRLGDVDRATQQHGLATVLGFISKTGVGGLTLGGGLGYLTRRFGWTVDNLEEVEIVTADGEIRIANHRENADLFWALRGGGGNFGVVTRFTYRLHEVGPTVFGGLIAFPFDRADEVLHAYRRLTTSAPRELSVWLILMRAPPLPFVPVHWQGERVCAMAVCWTGNLAHAEEAIAPIRALGESIVDMLREQPYVELQSYLDAGEPEGMHYYWKTELAAALSDEMLDTTRQLFAGCPVPGAELGFLHLGDAIAARPFDDGAVGNRDARYAIGVNGSWPPDEVHADRYCDWIRQAWERLRPFGTGGNYINFQTVEEDEDRIRATYGRNYERLARVKRAYDPGNLFRVNRNIRPSAQVAPG